MKRKVKFHVMTMKWDNIYSCYYGTSLFESDNYEQCEAYAISYQGTEETVFIQKVFYKDT